MADFRNLASHNSKVKFVLVVIMVLSKRLYLEALKTKKSEEVAEAFQRIFERMSPFKPSRLQTDLGDFIFCFRRL